jgi:dTDP-4-dehydrorhamnose 3,5-epimerase
LILRGCILSVLLVRPRRYGDARGWFCESWNGPRFAEWGIDVAFCQDNHSLSSLAGTLRGLHFQTAPHAQAKLVRCTRGAIFDVAIDIRKSSPTYRKWVSAELSVDNGDQLFIPAGYAHGFLTLTPDTEVIYKVDAHYAPEADGGIIWNDATLGIDWPLRGAVPLLSDKDALLPALADVTADFAYAGRPLLPLVRIEQ